MGAVSSSRLPIGGLMYAVGSSTSQLLAPVPSASQELPALAWRGLGKSRSRPADCVREDLWRIVAPPRSNDQASKQSGTSASAPFGPKRRLHYPPFRLHSDRNFLRALPCKFFAFACSEQALETARLSGLLISVVDEGGAAGVGACANAAPVPITKHRIVAVTKDLDIKFLL